MDRLRERIDDFLTALEREREQVDLANRRRPQLGALYDQNSDLFATSRITEVQRTLAGSGGGEEKKIRSLLEFAARGRAKCQASDQLDQMLSWEVFGAVQMGESRIPVRQIDGALGVATDPDRRHMIEEAYLETLDEQGYLAEDYLDKHREAIGELGYGTHVEAFQVLGSIDLQAIARKGQRFIDETEGMYRDLLAYHLPRVTGVSVKDARASDGVRLQAAPEYDRFFTGTERNRAFLEAFGGTGLDSLAEGRISVDWEAYLGGSGASCRPIRVPEDVHLHATPRGGRPAVDSFLHAYGLSLHYAYTDPELPVEHRRLGDEAVPLASAGLLQSLLRTPAFLHRMYDLPTAELADYLGLAALCTLLAVRREVARLQFELSWYTEDRNVERYAELFTEATGLRYDVRSAVWGIDGEFSGARRLRAAQLSAILATAMRNRFDQDWYRNPDAGGYLEQIFENGRRYSAPELAVQLSSNQLSYQPLIESLQELV